jgi:hypothetical protein
VVTINIRLVVSHRLVRLYGAYTQEVERQLAGALGFEPRDAGIKTLCLTAWRRPKQAHHYAKRRQFCQYEAGQLIKVYSGNNLTIKLSS